jgi:hypothetical protein
MYAGKIVFAQLIEFMPLHIFRRCVANYQGNYKVRNFSCLDQYLCMAFAQITYRESLRDIEACLRSQKNKLYHMGIRGKVSRSTIADANELRDWRIYAELAQTLIITARDLYSTEPFLTDLDETVYALDSTTIDLCLSMFPWATFRKNKGAVKLHTLLDLRGSIPTFIHISDGKLHDVNALDVIPVEPGAFYVMDRGYVDFGTTLYSQPGRSFFRHSSKIKYQMQQALLPSGRSWYPINLRSDYFSDRDPFTQRLPGETPPGQISRCRVRQNLGLSNKQFFFTSIDYSTTLPFPLAGGIIFQMDQTESANKNLLRHIRERGEIANLDCCIGIHPRGNNEKTTSYSRKPLHNPTNFKCNHFRANSNISATYRSQLQN